VKKEKKETQSQSSQTRKRGRTKTVDDFVTPAPKKAKTAKTTTKTKLKKEPEVKNSIATAKQAAILDLIDDGDGIGEDESVDTSTVQTKKWGSRKKSV